ncbi:MAG: HlyD family efflux transporter periplasmic adaptor subunit [Polyangiales bacterium]
MKRVVLVVVGLACVLVGLIAWRIRAQQRAEGGPPSGSGVIESRGIDLSARLSARVTRVLGAEGQSVAAGAVILELACDEPRARLAEAQGRLGQARGQAAAAHAQAEAALGQRSAARASIDALGGQAAALVAQQQAAEREAARVEAMGEHAAFAARDRARAAATGLGEQERAARASQSASRGQAAAAAAQADAAHALAEAASASVAALEALVASAKVPVEECAIRAPWAGVLERVYFDPGELVAPGAVVARLIDPEIARVTFYVANADVAEARVGDAAEVHAYAYPARSFHGNIRRVAREAEFTPRNVQTRSDRDRLVFPVEVEVPKHERLLRAGMPATVVLGGKP